MPYHQHRHRQNLPVFQEELLIDKDQNNHRHRPPEVLMFL
jgi:hypothetical protein